MALPLKDRVQAAVKLNDIANALTALVTTATAHRAVYDALTADEKTAMISVLTTAEVNQLVAWFALVQTFVTTAQTTAPAFLPVPAPPGGP